eukprot:s1121_g8.t1
MPCRSSCDPYLFYDVAEGVSNVAFTGQERRGLSGNGVYTQEYLVYLAEDASGTARSQVESAVPVGALPQRPKWVEIEDLGEHEQSSPASLAFQDAVAIASNLAFTDNDLDRDEIGGDVTWTPPTD